MALSFYNKFLIFFLLVTLSLLRSQDVVLYGGKLKLSLPHSYYNGKISKYNILCEFYPNESVIKGVENLLTEWIWNVPQRKLYFHLYPNNPVFRDKGGYARIIESYVNGTEVNVSFENENQDVFSVTLPFNISRGTAVNVTLIFEVKIPFVKDRFGYSGKVYALGNWYPILAVYDGERWHTNSYFSYGESFYSRVAFYNVTIRYPEGYVIATTGVKVYERPYGRGYLEGKWVTPLPVRDFAWTSSKYYKLVSENIYINGKNVSINLYYLPKQTSKILRTLEIAKQALKIFSSLFGEYIYPVLNLCEVEGWFLGMEYPMLIMVSSRLYLSDDPLLLENVIAHEIAHQWWYAMVGNDQASHPFLDESLATYSQLLYIEQVYGRSAYKERVKKIRDTYFKWVKEGKDYSLSSNVWSFSDKKDYLITYYYKGPLLLHYLRWIMGDKLFFSILKTVYNDYLLLEIDLKGFAEEIKELAEDISFKIFNYYLGNDSIPLVSVYAICSVNKDNLYEVSVSFISDVHVPLMIPVSIKEGDDLRGPFRVKANEVLTYTAQKLPIIIEVDPSSDALIMLDNDSLIISECYAYNDHRGK